MNAAGIAYIPRRVYPPRPCAWCKQTIQAPVQKNQLTHEGECRMMHTSAIQAAYKKRKRRAA